WPFPFPLVSENGAWHFDPDAGVQEVVVRRVGENELAAIEASRALTAALANGGDFTVQPDGSAAANAANVDGAMAFHGYYFGRLTAATSQASGPTKQPSEIG